LAKISVRLKITLALGLGFVAAAFGFYARANAEVVINRKQPLEWKMSAEQD
jgi:hypothetical protein